MIEWVERLLAGVSAYSQEHGLRSLDGELLYKIAEERIAEGRPPKKRFLAGLIAAPIAAAPYDPWEPMNRHIYRFNANFDKFVFFPLVDGYRFILPQFVRTGVSNFFSNIGETTIIVNSILQFAPVKTAKSVARLTVNSTIGIGGLFDVARHWNLPGEHEDFGQTLGFYGVGPGPYLVLPILGPSSLRDTSGLAVDWAMTGVPLLIGVPAASPYTTGASFLSAFQTRDDLSFGYGELGPFEYLLIRKIYFEFRELQVAN